MDTMDQIDQAGRSRIRRMAIHLARKRARHNDPLEVARDLEQAAYLRLLTLKTRQYLWKDLEYAMLEELSRWIYGCKRGRGKDRVLTIKYSIDQYVHVWRRPRRLSEVLV